MTKPVVTLATSAEMPNLFRSEAGLLDALKDAGIDARIAIWNDPSVDWNEAGMVIVRSVVDYAKQRQAFLEWTRTVPKLINRAEILEWNTDKHYFNDLDRLGLPTIPTGWLEPSDHLSKHRMHTRLPARGDFVVKPAVSSGVRDIGRYTANDPYQRSAAITQVKSLLQGGQSVMIQRYVEDIDTHGEISLIFFNGLISHAVEKRAMLHPASVTDPAMHESVVSAREADSQIWTWGEQIRRILHMTIREKMGHDEQLLFCRVDVVPDGEGSFQVMEISLTDADLYLDATPDALHDFVGAIAARAFW